MQVFFVYVHGTPEIIAAHQRAAATHERFDTAFSHADTVRREHGDRCDKYQAAINVLTVAYEAWLAAIRERNALTDARKAELDQHCGLIREGHAGVHVCGDVDWRCPDCETVISSNYRRAALASLPSHLMGDYDNV